MPHTPIPIPIPDDVIRRAQAVRLLVLDVDGVMTDGTLFITPDGDEIKAFHVLDGQGLKMLRQVGIAVAVISGRKSSSLEARLRALRIEHAWLGCENKLEPFQQLLHTLQLPASACAYMGDDVIDLPPLVRAGLAASVPNAPLIVQQHAHWISQHTGGHGAVRELCDLILTAQGHLDALIAPFLTHSAHEAPAP